MNTLQGHRHEHEAELASVYDDVIVAQHAIQQHLADTQDFLLVRFLVSVEVKEGVRRRVEGVDWMLDLLMCDMDSSVL